MTLEDLGLTRDTISLVFPHIKTTEGLAGKKVSDLLAIEGVKRVHIREIKARLQEKGKDLIPGDPVSMAFITKFKKRLGRPRGSRDKTTDRTARLRAAKSNPWKNGNGTHSSDNDRFTIETIKIDKEEVKKYGRMWRKALTGDHSELEEDLADTMGLNYAIYRQIGDRLFRRGYVDIPIYALGPDGQILRDDQGNQVLRAIKNPKGEVDVYLALQKSLGIDASDMNITAKSQNRARKTSDKGALADVENAKSELDANREQFGKKGNHEQDQSS